MRVLGFSQRWDKLSQDRFTTFRYPRRDKIWRVGEEVQIVLHPRHPVNREYLGTAEIIDIQKFNVWDIPDEVARLDGFENADAMREWLRKAHGSDVRWIYNSPIDCLTIQWIVRGIPQLPEMYSIVREFPVEFYGSLNESNPPKVLYRGKRIRN